jgi:hypothetical protein
MRVRRTAVGLATFGLVLGATTVLDATVLSGTALAGTPVVPAAACKEGATRGGRPAGTLQTCKNGAWVSTKCPASRPVVQSYAGPPPFAMCAPRGAR